MEWRRSTGNYDCRNRLIQAGDTRYTYDAENHRIGVETDKTITRYVVDTQQELTRILQAVETDTTTGEIRTTYYTYGKGLLAQEDEKNEYRLYHFNHLGSTTLITDEGGKVVETFEYNPYGELLDGEIGAYPFLFNGEYGVVTDTNGLYYMRARYYNVDIKRFMNQDVIVGSVENSPSLNRYAYVEGNPVNYLDLFGLEKWVSEFKFQHELFDEWSRNLMIINCLLVVVTIIYPPAIVLTGPLTTMTSIIGFEISILNLLFYSFDAVSAYLSDEDEAFKIALDGMFWSTVSVVTGGLGIFNDFDMYYNLIDSVLKVFENDYYRVEEIRLWIEKKIKTMN